LPILTWSKHTTANVRLEPASADGEDYLADPDRVLRIVAQDLAQAIEK
jgi:hypothetical protein